jgi:hypothetical protein
MVQMSSVFSKKSRKLISLPIVLRPLFPALNAPEICWACAGGAPVAQMEGRSPSRLLSKIEFRTEKHRKYRRHRTKNGGRLHAAILGKNVKKLIQCLTFAVQDVTIEL